MVKIHVHLYLNNVRLDAHIRRLLELDREKQLRDGNKKEENTEVKTSKEKKHPKKP